MSQDQDLGRIDELRTLLVQANIAYYDKDGGESIMSDRDFDARLCELQQLELDYPEVWSADSPTRVVGHGKVDSFQTVEHAVPMQSVDNTYTIGEVQSWYERVAGDGPAPLCTCDPKIDGVAVSLRYEAGRLVRAVTRGDGVRGDDITAQVKRIQDVPVLLGHSPPAILEVRGELFMPNSIFEQVNAQREAAGDPLFANSRNLTAGTLKSLDTGIVAKRKLSFLAHGRGEVNGLVADGYAEFQQALSNLGIPISPLMRSTCDIDELVSWIEQFASQRDSLGFGVDGMVVRIDTFAVQAKLGATSKSPRWCIAFKYPAEQGRTVLERVDWQVGRNGTLTPRATMTPIGLAGTTVSHATLHNIEEIRRKDIRIGDAVWVEKAGEIIPQVVSVIVGVRKGSEVVIEPPVTCPACSGPVGAEGPKLYCLNPECPAQLRERIAWFAGRGQMNIDGLGEKVVDQLVDAGLIAHIADLYAITVDDLIPLERFAQQSAEKLVEAIAASRQQGLARVLAAIGIRQVGRSASRTLAKHFVDVAALRRVSIEELAALPDFGDITAGLLHGFLHAAAGHEVFERLAAAGVDLTSRLYRAGDAEDAPWEGRKVVLTGTLEGFNRRVLTEQLEGLGATVSGTVSAKTDLVIAGDNAGSKLAKARDLGLEVWNEQQLVKALAAE
jgi:DNA ligase (NAD+)